MDSISGIFSVRDTDYGGRACFSNLPLSRGTVVIDAEDSLGESISYEFRKEVCHQCFLYDHGRTMKWRISASDIRQLEPNLNCKGFQGAGLWFCSQRCRDDFLQQQHVIELIQGYENLLHGLKMAHKRGPLNDIDEQKLNSVPISQQLIDKKWQQLQEIWIQSVKHLKPSKRLSQCPRITDDMYCCARSICRTLFQLKYLDTASATRRSFDILQSNELSKISKYPILLGFQTAVYQILYILLPPILHAQLSVPLFRHILGAEYGNAFGIWQPGESVGDREYLGCRLFPRASFFNHSCDPNIDKITIGRKICFTLNKNVEQGTQLCIAYNCNLTLPVHERRRIMRENWFFDCLCDRCFSEL